MNNLNLLPSILAFTEVAKNGSFTHAAKNLGLSKATVSLQVKRLEEHLGQELLTRNTRNMSLTAVGNSLLKKSEQLQGQVNSALEQLHLSKETPSGRFALTIPHTLEVDIVLPALQQLCIEYPLLEPYIHVSDETHDLIENDLDIAIHGGNMKDSDYKALLIGKAREVFCASPGYIAANGEPENIASLIKAKCVAAPWQKNALQIRSLIKAETKAYSLKFSATTNNFASTIAMVKSDMGLALLPEFSIRESILKGQVKQVMEEYQGREWPFYFVHRYTKEKPVHIDRFFQLIKHYFNQATTL